MKLRDALVGLMFWLLVLVVVFSVSVISGPIWFVIAAAVVVWILYILVIIRDHRMEKNKPRPLFWLEIQGEWRAIDGYGNLVPPDQIDSEMYPKLNIYDQEEDER